jgi:lipoyl synthase
MNENKTKPLRKPEWIRVKLHSTNKINNTKKMLRAKRLHTVCEEANCPNQGECFCSGTATFIIMGDICTRSCKFCNIKHDKPHALDITEPENLVNAVREMNLKYVVITSVDRDDLKDGGANHYLKCIQAIRTYDPKVKIEILVPDFRGCEQQALDILAKSPPDVFNHNIETVPRLYKTICPGCDYSRSLSLLQAHKKQFPAVLTKSGLMVGLGETDDEIKAVMQDLRKYQVDMLTIGQYLQPSKNNISVERYVMPIVFQEYAKLAKEIGFKYVASGPLVRSSYHAAEQTDGVDVA